MRIDTELLAAAQGPIVRFYSWKRLSFTHGYFLNPWDHLDQNLCREAQVCVAKRPTGGGLLCHGSDVTFSLVVPNGHFFYMLNPLEAYQAVHGCVVEALERMGIGSLSIDATASTRSASWCFAKPTAYDIMWKGKKVGGAAQRRTAHALLHQGSILFAPWSPLAVLLKRQAVGHMMEVSHSLFSEESEEKRAAFMEYFIEKLCQI